MVQFVFAFEKASVAAAKSDISDVNFADVFFPVFIGSPISDVSKGVLVACPDGVIGMGSVGLTVGEGGGVWGAFGAKVAFSSACESALSKVRIMVSKPFKLGTK